MHQHHADVTLPKLRGGALWTAGAGLVHAIQDDVGVRFWQAVLFIDQEPDTCFGKSVGDGHVVLPEVVVSEDPKDTEAGLQARQQPRELGDIAMIQGHIVPAQEQQIGRRLGDTMDGCFEQAWIRQRACMQV
jgi:hypothetical protein